VVVGDGEAVVEDVEIVVVVGGGVGDSVVLLVVVAFGFTVVEVPGGCGGPDTGLLSAPVY
jgi:hypothetical protein